MQSIRFNLICSFVLVLGITAGCDKPQAPAKSTGSGSAAPAPAPAAAPPMAQAPAAAPAMPAPAQQPPAAMGASLRGKVKETMDAGGYTYVLVEAEMGEKWAAAREFAVNVGDEVILAGMMPMRDFRSPSLDRVFEEILFVGEARIVGGGEGEVASVPPTGDSSMPAMPAGHPPLEDMLKSMNAGSGEEAEIDTAVEALADGVTVETLVANRGDYDGQIVRFRGKVVKANRGILGRNWLHIQDGTGGPGTNDVCVTSKLGFAPVGTTVIVEGSVGLDRDFGSGYSYTILVEDATITAETADEDG